MVGAAESFAVGYEIYQIAKREGWLDKLKHVLTKKHYVLVLGSSGAGKTNFLTSLVEQMPAAIDASDRTRITAKSPISIADAPFVFLDTPGQSEYHSLRGSAIRDNLHRISLLINVVSYGYHEYELGEKMAFNSDGTVSEKFLEDHQSKEIAQLTEWTDILGTAHSKYRLLTVITKADLWWNRRDEVIRHYQKGGKYFTALENAQQLSPVAVAHCSVFHRFYARGKMSGEFDANERDTTRRLVLKTISELVE